MAAPILPANNSQLYYWRNPAPDDIAPTCMEFLHQLPGPTHIFIEGQEKDRCRAVVTLMHGNEPSGLHAVFGVLREAIKPLVDIHIFIPSVDAAKQAPGFIYRMLPHQKDLNRCFKEPFGDSNEDKLAEELLDNLKALNPECIIDIHNTSGSSPSFGVSTFMDDKHDALVSLFTHRMIVTDLKLGALMEISESMIPTVTIECGGIEDSESNPMALDGLIKFMTLNDVLSTKPSDMSLEFFHHPIRLELLEGSDIAYGTHSLVSDGVTLVSEIENHNFGFVDQDTLLGFVSGELKDNLTACDTKGRERITDYFRLQGDELYPAQKLKLFMVTTNPEIARKDCLFYLVLAID